jgi:lipoprotein-anchoring transpeptidase ErfK/SrfK
MTRRLINLMLAAILGFSVLAGAVSPAIAAPNPPDVAAAQPATASSTEPGTTTDGAPTATDIPAAASKGEKWIEVILSQHRLLAHEGSTIYLSSLVSVGKPSTPTVRGTYRIYVKLRSTRMRGPGYNLPNVPHTMYFYRGYAIHGAYWVKKFGTNVSHGCVNVNLADAAKLFSWAPVGTRVVIH